ncbi:MAG: helix-turn-helix domain-containing protein, partial [Sandaracinaceae bacterium]
LTVPPLRERVQDVPLLVRHVLVGLARAVGREPPRVARSALERLTRHPWPGNVRELVNVMTRAYVLGAQDRVSADDLELAPPTKRRARSRAEYDAEEQERILRALDDTRWNVRAACRQLGMPSNTLYRRLQRYGIERPER